MNDWVINKEEITIILNDTIWWLGIQSGEDRTRFVLCFRPEDKIYEFHIKRRDEIRGELIDLLNGVAGEDLDQGQILYLMLHVTAWFITHTPNARFGYSGCFYNGKGVVIEEEDHWSIKWND